MKLTKEQAIENHRKMWNWIAEQTILQERKVSKQEYFVANNLEKPAFNDCYLCSAVSPSKEIHCCLLDWRENSFFNTCVSDPNSLYRLWLHCLKEDWKQAAEYAKQIANLPERK